MLLEPIQGKIEHEAVFTEEQDSVQPVGVGPAPLVLQDQTGVAEQPLDTGRGGGRGEVAHRHPEQRRHQGVVAVQLLLAGVVPGGEGDSYKQKSQNHDSTCSQIVLCACLIPKSFCF